MSFQMLILFISLFTTLADGNSKWTKPEEPNCKVDHYELFPNGPCQPSMTYCQNGKSFQLKCAEPLIFNPSSKFCEKPEDFMIGPIGNAAAGANFLPKYQPFVGEADSSIGGADQPSFSVLMPPNIYQPSFVGHIPQQAYAIPNYIVPPLNSQPFIAMHPEVDDESSYSVLMTPNNDFRPPLVGKTDSSEEDHSSFSVLMSPNDIQQRFVGLTDEQEADDSSYSVLMNPNNDNTYPAPFIGHTEHGKSSDSDDSSYSVFVPSTNYDHPPPFIGHYIESEEPEADDSSKFSVLMPPDNMQQFDGGHSESEELEANEDFPALAQPNNLPHFDEHAESMQDESSYPILTQANDFPFIAEKENTQLLPRFIGTNEDNKKSSYTRHSPEEDVYDGFMAKHQPTKSQSHQQSLVDDFKSAGRQSYSPKISPFATFDHPADSGHDSFKPKIKSQTIQSKFAPMNTPVEFGHDIFKTRQKRSTPEYNNNSSAALDGDSMAVCLQLYANQLANRAISGFNLSTQCVRNQIPNGCRQFYIACVNGRQIQRQCPVGLFFDPIKEICKERSQIAVCFVHQSPKALAESIFRQQQQKPSRPMAIQTQHGPKIVNTNATVFAAPANTSQIIINTPATSSITPNQNNTTPGLPASVHPVTPRRLKQPKKAKSQQKTQIPVLPLFDNFPERFCSELHDGFYRHPKNCSRIIQCFGHELFEYPSCQHNLAFNQLTGVCDYPANVLGCSQANGNDQMDFTILEAGVDIPNDAGQQESSSNTSNHHTTSSSSVSLDLIGTCAGGHSHGDHIEHPDHCSAFLRCVWGTLVPMSCPKGTAFNPMLSVCDYPDHVPNCELQ